MYTLEVLIPVYNDLPGLIKTINSIDNIDLSITVVDDGSTDSICLSNFQNFKANIKLINLKVNSGIIKALNTGLDSLIESNPKYIFRIDAGDIFCFEGIQERLNFIINEKVGIIGGGTKFIDEKSAKGFVSNRISNNPSKLFPLVTNYIHSGIIFKYTELRYNPKNKFCEDVFLFKEIEDIYGGKRVKNNYHV